MPCESTPRRLAAIRVSLTRAEWSPARRRPAKSRAKIAQCRLAQMTRGTEAALMEVRGGDSFPTEARGQEIFPPAAGRVRRAEGRLFGQDGRFAQEIGLIAEAVGAVDGRRDLGEAGVGQGKPKRLVRVEKTPICTSNSFRPSIQHSIFGPP